MGAEYKRRASGFEHYRLCKPTRVKTVQYNIVFDIGVTIIILPRCSFKRVEICLGGRIKFIRVTTNL